jgi:hypothetical protein
VRALAGRSGNGKRQVIAKRVIAKRVIAKRVIAKRVIARGSTVRGDADTLMPWRRLVAASMEHFSGHYRCLGVTLRRSTWREKAPAATI